MTLRLAVLLRKTVETRGGGFNQD